MNFSAFAFKALFTSLCFLFTLPLSAYDPPTMGWSSWNTYRVNISDSLIKKQATALVETGLSARGYRYINIDDGYFGGRDDDGKLLVHPQRFPEGLLPVVQHIHSLGLKAGIYSDAGSNTCGNYWDKDTLGVGVGFYGHDDQDARFFFDSLKFDFIKIDFCGGDPAQNTGKLALSEKERYTAIRQAIQRATSRPVRVNICRWAFPGTWASAVGSSWRVTPDIRPSWQSVKSIIAENRYLSAFAVQGTFNDMDMLEIGRGLTLAEERTHFGMWCMLSSPLLIGCDLTTIPRSSLDLLLNPDLIAINQDTLCLQAYLVNQRNGVELYVKDLYRLNSCTRAVALYNPTDSQTTYKFHPHEVLLSGKVQIYDAFAQKQLSDNEAVGINVDIAPHDTRIFILTATERLPRTHYEAETAWLQRYQELGMNPLLGYAQFVSDSEASGGAKVAYIGNHPDNWLEWRNVYIPKDGTYTLTFHVKSPEQRIYYCSVDGARQHQFKALKGQSIQHLKVKLKKGLHRVRLFNPHNWMPDIDYMHIK